METVIDDDERLQQYLRDLPKVELHAHLNGCIRETTLFELAEERGVQLSSHHFASPDNHPLKDHHMYNVLPRSLEDCFDMFAEIPACVNDLAALERITWEALKDFASHHVVYLELRSTPKRLLHSHSDDSAVMKDKKDYIETILKVLEQFQEQEEQRYRTETSEKKKSRLSMVCRFIVAIDRSQSLQEAAENISLAIELSQRPNSLVVGVDLGGNPTKQDFRDFLPLFQKARDAGLNVTLHCAEIPCSDSGDTSMRRTRDEAAAILEFRPNRLGHALLLPPSLQQVLSNLQIPVETCPTSNVMTLELAKVVDGSLIHGLQQHPALRLWLQANHPLAIGTDDPGVFDTTATKELLLLVHAFGMNKERIAELVIKSIDYAFCENAIRAKLKKHIQCRVEEMKQA